MTPNPVKITRCNSLNITLKQIIVGIVALILFTGTVFPASHIAAINTMTSWGHYIDEICKHFNLLFSVTNLIQAAQYVFHNIYEYIFRACVCVKIS